MIVLDIETSGLDTGRNGIWQIGAVELENPDNYFLEEGRIDEDDEVNPQALEVTEKTEEELRDRNKQPQKQLILDFLEWAAGCNNKLTIGHNVGFDLFFIQNKCIRYNIHDKFSDVLGVRSMDLHSLAQFRHNEIDGGFALNDFGKSIFNLSGVLKFCGLEDHRKNFEKGKLVKEGTPHSALEDAKLTAECFSRLIYGKKLFGEFLKFEIPEYLAK